MAEDFGDIWLRRHARRLIGLPELAHTSDEPARIRSAETLRALKSVFHSFDRVALPNIFQSLR